ncbi:hypothetical protein PF003_g31138 [Phytophthora fragariae]|nr:hypothetical protein PF003_g31138 [Phytophthora fragariae]
MGRRLLLGPFSAWCSSRSAAGSSQSSLAQTHQLWRTKVQLHRGWDSSARNISSDGRLATGAGSATFRRALPTRAGLVKITGARGEVICLAGTVAASNTGCVRGQRISADNADVAIDTGVKMLFLAASKLVHSC